MKLQLVPSAIDGCRQTQFLSSYLINDQLVVDAGSIGFTSDLAVQRAVKHVLLTHSHIDHIASLGPLIDNTRKPGDEPLTIHCSEVVAEALRGHYFNDVLWPNLLNLPTCESPYAQLKIFKPGQAFQVAEFEVLPVNVSHTVPCVGFLIRDDTSSILLSGDTSATDELWQHARRCASLKAIVLEVAFPNEMQSHAEIAMHLTPQEFGREVAKLGNADVKIFAVHLKAAYQAAIVKQLNTLGLANLQPLEAGRTYRI